MLSRFHLIPERYGQTDGQTDRFAVSISRVIVLTRDKNVTAKACSLLIAQSELAHTRLHSRTGLVAYHSKPINIMS